MALRYELATYDPSTYLVGDEIGIALDATGSKMRLNVDGTWAD